VVVDATACLENAARSIVSGASFDNNLLCIGEKQCVRRRRDLRQIDGDVAQNRRLSELNSSQISALTKVAFKPETTVPCTSTRT